jgi:hypothetical protein
MPANGDYQVPTDPTLATQVMGLVKPTNPRNPLSAPYPDWVDVSGLPANLKPARKAGRESIT